ncbi:hypothetical protein PTKIN_Ptkin01aG0116400 [Pterospermum kingtungense]
MDSKLVWFMFLLLALATVVESTTFYEASWGLAHFGNNDSSSCIGGDCVNVEDVTKTLMDSATNHRQLQQMKKHISYWALRRNAVPCSRPGESYYNCESMSKANPYSRGCLAITQCKRFSDWTES